MLIAAPLLLYVAVLPGLLERMVGLPFIVKLLVSGGLPVPLGFAMGMPFPTGLRALTAERYLASNFQPDLRLCRFKARC